MKQQSISPSAPNNVFSFDFLRDSLWSRRWMIVGISIIGLLLGIGVTMLTGGKYAVSMTLIPAETDLDKESTLQLSSILSNSTALPVPKFKQFQAELYSYQTAQMMDRRYGSLCEISADRCDIATRSWRPKPAWRKTLSLALSTVLGMPPAPETPDIDTLVRFIKSNVTITAEKTSSLTTLSMEVRDPEKGKQFLTRLVDAANQTIRNRDRADMRQYVDYLSKRLETLTSVGQRSALDNLLLTEERRLMLTNVQVAYAATPIDGPNAIRANSAWKIGVGAGTGFALGCLIALILEFLAGGGIVLDTQKSKARWGRRGVESNA
jgi:uncharacterized protein involved in exopolysaccharide biosynthesis